MLVAELVVAGVQVLQELCDMGYQPHKKENITIGLHSENIHSIHDVASFLHGCAEKQLIRPRDVHARQFILEHVVNVFVFNTRPFFPSVLKSRAQSFWSVALSTFLPKTWMKVGRMVNGLSFFCSVGKISLNKMFIISPLLHTHT